MNGNFLKSEICVKGIRVNQGLGVHEIGTCTWTVVNTPW